MTQCNFKRNFNSVVRSATIAVLRTSCRLDMNFSVKAVSNNDYKMMSRYFQRMTKTSCLGSFRGWHASSDFAFHSHDIQYSAIVSSIHNVRNRRNLRDTCFNFRILHIFIIRRRRRRRAKILHEWMFMMRVRLFTYYFVVRSFGDWFIDVTLHRCWYWFNWCMINSRIGRRRTCARRRMQWLWLW